MTDQQPTLPVSVVIPVFNGAHLLDRALRSIASQQPRKPAEVIVVDDGSSDGSHEVAEAGGARVIRHERNLGLAAAKDTGIRAARHEWVALLDSDDEWLPGHLRDPVAAEARARRGRVVLHRVQPRFERARVSRSHDRGDPGPDLAGADHPSREPDSQQRIHGPPRDRSAGGWIQGRALRRPRHLVSRAEPWTGGVVAEGGNALPHASRAAVGGLGGHPLGSPRDRALLFRGELVVATARRAPRGRHRLGPFPRSAAKRRSRGPAPVRPRARRASSASRGRAGRLPPPPRGPSQGESARAQRGTLGGSPCRRRPIPRSSRGSV